MIRLKEQDFEKLTEMTGVSQFDLQKLYAMQLLHDALVLDMLIKYDFKKLGYQDKFRSAHIIARLSEHYGVSEEKVRNAAYSKPKRYYYCEKCDRRIAKRVYLRNQGICDKCAAAAIKL